MSAYRLLTSISFIVGILALVLPAIWITNQNETNTVVNHNLANLTDRANHLQLEHSMTQSQMVEILMSSSNSSETITLQEGTFVWSIGARAYRYPGRGCNNIVPTGFAIDAAGTGYRIGDLITVGGYFPQFFNNAVLKVISVGLLGEVLSFEILTPGCMAGNPFGNSSIITLSVLGSGFVVKVFAPPYPPINIDTYNVFATPQNTPVAPLQYANYSLRKISIQSIEYTLLYLYSPEFPIITQSFEISNIFSALTVALYEFEPAVPELQALGDYGYTFPLTKKNIDAINLTDSNNNCFNTNPDCWLDASGDTSRSYPNAVNFFHNAEGTNLQISNAYIMWHFNSRSGFYDYVGNNAVLSLNYPLMFVFPTV